MPNRPRNLALARAGHAAPLLSALLAAAAPCRAQDALWFKFDEGGNKLVANFASGANAGPNPVLIVSTDTTGFAPGWRGTALRGATSATATTWLETGWKPAFSGSFTVALWMRQRGPAAPNLNPSYLFSVGNGTGMLRLFTGGVAGTGLRCRSFEAGGQGQELSETRDVQAPAKGAWEHIALVVDAWALTALFFQNGVPGPLIPLNAGAGVVAETPPFRVGAYGTPASFPSFYDIDEFRFVLRPASTFEIAAWATRPTAASAEYGISCLGASLASAGGAPSVGNAGYALRLMGKKGSFFGLALGTSRVLLGGAVPLPVDLMVLDQTLSGCLWESSADVWISGVATTLATTIPLPIPNTTALDGAVLFNQVLLAGGGTYQVTNGLCVAIGQ